MQKLPYFVNKDASQCGWYLQTLILKILAMLWWSGYEMEINNIRAFIKLFGMNKLTYLLGQIFNCHLFFS